ncbi:hypothetical protein SUGI_0784470 [Cryptomeria japonica]|uniref:uncharacterized protein LOC131038976 n=1 Tax=Cryptomeria japonica TaxID=3369 RepID=UPI002414A841|nr:uncharacterized protein LOC131038976 [Cryptomeria japonica]XP_057827589.1 uncharacterized protein LOC131038976 [Cryptomeria japonica]XP_057827590.1 uncharacterized protein LOC131038976 [Cryptomeria japonica]GLJ38498.1 hypothetical protein SUGI_0784470 [Cryptomeria japonica]
MAKIGTAAAKLKVIAKTGNMTETFVKGKQTIKAFEERFKAAAADSVNIRMHKEEEQRRIPLKDVVTLCTKRWFQDTLKEARSGDVGMQILVGQMYCNGYGVPQSTQKGKAWFQEASKSRLKYLALSSKPPGYNASESDSDKKDNKKK